MAWRQAAPLAGRSARSLLDHALKPAAGAVEPVAAVALVTLVTMKSGPGVPAASRTSAGGILMTVCDSGAASMAQPELAEMLVIEVVTHSLVKRCCS